MSNSLSLSYINTQKQGHWVDVLVLRSSTLLHSIHLCSCFQDLHHVLSNFIFYTSTTLSLSHTHTVSLPLSLSLLAPGLDGLLPVATMRWAFAAFSTVLELGVEVEAGTTDEAMEAGWWALICAWRALWMGSSDLCVAVFRRLELVRQATCFTVLCRCGSRWGSENPVVKKVYSSILTKCVVTFLVACDGVVSMFLPCRCQTTPVTDYTTGFSG